MLVTPRELKVQGRLKYSVYMLPGLRLRRGPLEFISWI